jgi:dolichol-phosphate mannosyltransferase
MKSTTQTAVIVIPTYNEAGSIGKMIDYLCTNTFPSLDKKWDMKILVVDGNSPDGTSQVVEEKSKKYKNVFLFTETSKDGIGAAYLKGFKYGIEKLGADFLFEMDGDFQHPPATIPLALNAIDEGYDYVIGSRKIEGGSNPSGWGFKRLFFSEVGGFTARVIMFFPFKNFFKVTDPTTGFKVTRVKGFVDHLNLNFDHLYTKSFGYKLQLLFETLKLGARFKEVPLVFNVRNAGESKIEPQTAKDIFIVAFKLRWFDDFTQKFLKFGTVGFIGYIFNALGLIVFAGITNIEWLIWLLATEVAIISNFTLNNLWTFKSDKISGSGAVISKFFQFNLSSVGAIIIQAVAGSIGVTVFGLSRQLLLPFIIVFLVLPYNWLMYNTFIWKKK